MDAREKVREVMLAPVINRRESWRSEIETQRNAIHRDCPAGVVLDRKHQLARVAGVMVAGIGAPMARRALIRGLLADGFVYDEVARALAASDDEMERATGELPIWATGRKKLDELLAREIPTLANDAGYDVTSSRVKERQGDLQRGSRGWRTPPDAFPQTTTPPHA